MEKRRGYAKKKSGKRGEKIKPRAYAQWVEIFLFISRLNVPRKPAA
jgi:hypothetical protein